MSVSPPPSPPPSSSVSLKQHRHCASCNAEVKPRIDKPVDPRKPVVKDALSYLFSGLSVVSGGPAAVLAQPLFRVALNAVDMAWGAYRKEGKLSGKLMLNAFFESLKADFGHVKKELIELKNRPKESLKRYFLSEKLAHKTWGHVGAIVGGLAGASIAGPVGAIAGFALGRILGRIMGKMVVKLAKKMGIDTKENPSGNVSVNVEKGEPPVLLKLEKVKLFLEKVRNMFAKVFLEKVNRSNNKPIENDEETVSRAVATGNEEPNTAGAQGR